jgi:hypothetical protein
MDAIEAGIRTKFQVLPTEKLEDLRELAASYYRLLPPTSPEERRLIDQVIQTDWLLTRCQKDDTLLERHFDAAVRAYSDTMQALDKYYGLARLANHLLN